MPRRFKRRDHSIETARRYYAILLGKYGFHHRGTEAQREDEDCEMNSFRLSDENERFIEDELAEGNFWSRDELMNDALAQFRTYRNLMRRIDEGTEQLANGQYLELDAEGLKAFFDDVKARGRERQCSGRFFRD